MQILRTPVAATFLVFWVAFGALAEASQRGAIGPAASAGDIRGSRGSDLAGDLQLTYAVFDSGTERQREVTVGIGKDYVHVTQGSVRTILDFRLRRVFDVDLETRRFFGHSLYGEVFSRHQELQARTTFQALLESANLVSQGPPDVQPFWREAVLGIAGSTPVDLEISNNNSVVIFRRHGRNIVQFAPATEIDASATERALFYKFARLALTLHPTIANGLEAQGALPQALVLRKPDDEESAWSLVQFERVQSGYPLPAEAAISLESIRGWESDVWHDAERHLVLHRRTDGIFVETSRAPRMDGLLPTMLAAVDGRHGDGPPLSEAWLGRMQVALENGAQFEAGLLWLEFNLLWGTTAVECRHNSRAAHCVRLQNVILQAKQDERLQFVLAAASTGQVEKALELWSTTPRSDAPTSYIADLFLANQMVTTRLADPRRANLVNGTENAEVLATYGLFQSVIEGNPYNASAYKDLGDFYQSQYDARRAWIAYDLGRGLANAVFVPNLRAVDDLESQIAARYPEFF